LMPPPGARTGAVLAYSTLRGVPVSDDHIPGVDCPLSTLLPGGSETCTGRTQTFTLTLTS
jgi:hypothetical protein